MTERTQMKMQLLEFKKKKWEIRTKNNQKDQHFHRNIEKKRTFQRNLVKNGQSFFFSKQI